MGVCVPACVFCVCVVCGVCVCVCVCVCSQLANVCIVKALLSKTGS